MTQQTPAWLTTAPPDACLRWAEETLGAGARITAARALNGGSSCAVHRLDLQTGTGPTCVVMKRFVRADWLAEEPDVPRRELGVLRLLDGSSVPMPRPLGADLAPEQCDVPAVLMSFVPGRTRAGRSTLARSVTPLAEMLVRIHALDAGSAGLPPYRPWYFDAPPDPPPWTRDPAAWREAQRVARLPPPSTATGFVHRDYNPWNVLWRNGVISGVLDWANACVGPQAIDIAHMRANLVAIGGPPLADRFFRAWQSAASVDTYDPYWDIVSAVELLPYLELSTPAVRRALDKHLIAAVRRR